MGAAQILLLLLSVTASLGSFQAGIFISPGLDSSQWSNLSGLGVGRRWSRGRWR